MRFATTDDYNFGTIEPWSGWRTDTPLIYIHKENNYSTLPVLVILVLLAVLIFVYCVLYPCCSWKGRRSFMSRLKWCFWNCFCRFDCVTPLSVNEAMSRYEEYPLLTTEELISSITKNRFMISILETLNIHMPDFFFTFLPSGSLRERFGKLLPSTSILAADYDIMLIPDAVSVGEEGVVYEGVRTPVFSAISAPNEHPDGFVWLKLQDKYLHQWEKLCLRRHINDEGSSLLSSTHLHEMLRKVLTESTEIRSAVEAQQLSHGRNTIITAERSGPAFTMKIQSPENPLYKYCGVSTSFSRDNLLFHADFTLALHCSFWPKQAMKFFEAEKRKHWPSVQVINTIKRLGCHVVPKESIDSLVKLTLEQAEYTTYGRSPGLEWRYSFSQAEMILSDNIPAPARTAYLSLKAINKRHLNKKGKEMKSYPLKCILFEVVESKDVTFWQRIEHDVADEILMLMLIRLKQCLADRVVPNYWIPTMNNLDSLTGSDCARKLKLLDQIVEAPQKYIADQWLEYNRCIRMNCCYCGDTNPVQHIFHSPEVEDVIDPSSAFCCSCNYKYSKGCCECRDVSKGFEIY